MRLFRYALPMLALLTASWTSAGAVDLKIATLNKVPTFPCVFLRNCQTIETTGQFTWVVTPQHTANFSLLTRTVHIPVTDLPRNTPDRTVYMYRLTGLTGGSTECIKSLVINFGPHLAANYDGTGLFDVFVVNQPVGAGPLAKINSVHRTGNQITINFQMGVCWSTFTNSAIIGLTATGAPMKSIAKAIPNYGTAPFGVETRVPTFLLPKPISGRIGG